MGDYETKTRLKKGGNCLVEGRTAVTNWFTDKYQSKRAVYRPKLFIFYTFFTS